MQFTHILVDSNEHLNVEHLATNVPWSFGTDGYSGHNAKHLVKIGTGSNLYGERAMYISVDCILKC